MTATPLHSGHQVRLLKGGADFFAALISAIDASQHEVRLETYIFSFDASGELVAAALERAALRGVAVFLVMDGVGTSDVPPQWAHRFTHARVQWHRFSPLGHWGLLIPVGWRRLHRKL
ncbi:MAG: cardiolipin synthase ClsB, partial [Burkholderiales bacterium]